MLSPHPSWSEDWMLRKRAGTRYIVMRVCVCVCVCVRVCSSFWLPTASRDGDWQDCDTKGVGDGEGRGWITKKNQFLPYACDLFQYIESFTDWKESNGRVNPLSWKIKIQNIGRSQYEGHKAALLLQLQEGNASLVLAQGVEFNQAEFCLFMSKLSFKIFWRFSTANETFSCLQDLQTVPGAHPGFCSRVTERTFFLG